MLEQIRGTKHFTVDGTLLEAWASVKSYQRKDAKNDVPPDDPGNATVDFRGERRSNQTHASKTDPDAKMARKGKSKEAKLSYNGNLMVKNRSGLIVNTEVFEANGCRSTAWKKASAMSPSSRRSRFLVNTVTSQMAASLFTLTIH